MARGERRPRKPSEREDLGPRPLHADLDQIGQGELAADTQHEEADRGECVAGPQLDDRDDDSCGHDECGAAQKRHGAEKVGRDVRRLLRAPVRERRIQVGKCLVPTDHDQKHADSDGAGRDERESHSECETRER